MKPRQLLTAMPLVITALGLGAATANAQSVSWTTVANNGDVMPGTDDTPFNSYNQPAINTNGVVIFRARSKGGGEEGGCGCGGDAPTNGGGGDEAGICSSRGSGPAIVRSEAGARSHRPRQGDGVAPSGTSAPASRQERSVQMWSTSVGRSSSASSA